jgi:hypothetical protein
MTWRYIHRDDVPEYELAGWINADRYETTRNKYFVLMIWDKAHGN